MCDVVVSRRRPHPQRAVVGRTFESLFRALNDFRCGVSVGAGFVMVAGVAVLAGLAPGFIVPFVILQDDAIPLVRQRQNFVGKLLLALNPATALGVQLG